jgi:hypothetical protein
MTGEEALTHAIWAAREAEEAASGHRSDERLRRTIGDTEPGRRADYPKATAWAGVAQAWAAIAAVVPD